MKSSEIAATAIMFAKVSPSNFLLARVTAGRMVCGDFEVTALLFILCCVAGFVIQQAGARLICNQQKGIER